MNPQHEKRRALGYVARCKDSPDNTGINEAAKANADIAKEALAWYKQQYADQTPQRERAANTANQVADQQLASSRQNDAISNDYWNYQKNTFRPLEAKMVSDAQTFDSDARKDVASGRAMADVEQQFGAQAEAQKRDMARMGVNPNSGRFAAIANQNSMAQAAAKAFAGTKARDNIELQGYARRSDAANMGRGLASSQATSAGVAMSAGNSAVNNAGVPLTQANNAASTMGQGFTTGINGNNSAGNLYGKAADIQQSSNNASMELMGTLAGAGITKWSDVNMKKNIKPVSDEQALKAIEKTPVSTWDYKKGKGDGGRHTGPMAQHVNKNMGEQAGPGGKMIDLVTLNGNNMAAIAALSRKVDKLAKAVQGA